MNEIHTSRFKDAPWFAKEEINTVIGGAGGIGSWLTLLLCRAGFTPVVYDFDRLEEHNLAGQMYSKQDAISNKLKVTALKENCKAFADTDINIFSERITEETMSHNYVFSAFDNMKARKDMFGAWKVFVEDWKSNLLPQELVDVEVVTYNVILTSCNGNKLATLKLVKDLLNLDLREGKDLVDSVDIRPGHTPVPAIIKTGLTLEEADELVGLFKDINASAELMPIYKTEKQLSNVPGDTPIFIDGRLRAEQMQIFCVTPDNIEEYEKHLFDDSEVEDAPCTLKQTSHSAAMIASHMVAFFTNHLTNNNAKDIERNVPFLWEYFIPLDYLTVE